MHRIVQIELTNHCNRQCLYCGIKQMTRPKGLADLKLIKRCVEVLKLIKQTDQVGLHHFGESLLHPRLIEFIKYFNENGITPFLNTNGDFLTDDMIDTLSKVKLSSLMISLHLPQNRRIELWRKCTDKGIKSWWQTNEMGGMTNLGGQISVEGVPIGTPLSDPMTQCGFLREQRAIVLWNGDLVPCCFDFDGKGIFGSIFDTNAAELVPKIFNVCKTCSGHPGG